MHASAIIFVAEKYEFLVEQITVIILLNGVRKWAVFAHKVARLRLCVN